MSLSAASDPTVYAVAKSFAASPDQAARVRLGASAETPAEILFYLANDPAVTVRAAVAMNDSTPVRAAHMLARDEDERVRALIARKLAALAPGLSEHEQERVRRQTYEALTTLVADEAVRVRTALADILKDMPDAPRALILALAQDPVIMVSEPVIRLSPLLSAQDLMALVTSDGAEQTAVAVARRPNLDEQVCDAIAATANVAAIGALLQNKSAAIRESTLDALVNQASARTDWHEPIVYRPALSVRSMCKLSEIVAGHLLEVLAARADVDPVLLAELRRRLAGLSGPEQPRVPAAEPENPARNSTTATPLAANGQVSEAKLLETVHRGEARSVSALMALAAGVPLPVVNRAASLRSTKGLLSLLWKGGFSMAVAGPVQSLLTRLPPNELLTADAAGHYPLAPDEMNWQIDFLSRGGR